MQGFALVACWGFFAAYGAIIEMLKWDKKWVGFEALLMCTSIVFYAGYYVLFKLVIHEFFDAKFTENIIKWTDSNDRLDQLEQLFKEK